MARPSGFFEPAPVTDEEREYLRPAGARLAELRRMVDLSQRELSIFSGCSPQTVMDMERGRRRLRRATVAYVVGVIADYGAEIDVEAETDHVLALAGPAVAEDGSAARNRVRQWQKRSERLQRLVLDGFSIEDAWRVIRCLRGT